jgi:predicted nucleic acid-binding protein
VIVLDTTVLAYSVGRDHPLREPCRRLLVAIRDGKVQATTTAEVIQEFAHVRARRTPRSEAVARARDLAQALSPFLAVDEAALDRGLDLFARHEQLGSFDAVLAATAIANDAEALLSADTAFASVRSLRHVAPGTPEFERLLG